VNMNKVISHRFPTADLAQAFDVALNEECMKVVVRQAEAAGVRKQRRFDGEREAAGGTRPRC